MAMVMIPRKVSQNIIGINGVMFSGFIYLFT